MKISHRNLELLDSRTQSTTKNSLSKNLRSVVKSRSERNEQVASYSKVLLADMHQRPTLMQRAYVIAISACQGTMTR